MTDPTTPLTAEAFDWNKVGPELEALGQAIADTIDPSNPMQSNESTMDCLEHLWSLGYRVVPHAAARRAIEGSGVVHEPVLFDPTGPVYDSLPHPKASRYELSGALLRDQSADPLADPDAYDRRILLVTVASAARALAALPHPEEPRVERCAVCGVGRWVTAHDPEAGSSHHPFTPEAR